MRSAFGIWASLLVCACVCAAGCGSDFVPGSRIAKLRVLAVRADRPFAAPGERVVLEALVVDPEARPLSWALGTCTNPAGSSVDACLAALDADLARVSPEGSTFSFDVPEDALSALPAAARPSASVGVVLAACPGTLAPGAGKGLPVGCLDANGDALPITEFELGIKRVFVRETDRNRNPRIAQVSWDGEPWPEDEVKFAEPCAADGFDIDDCPARLRHRIQIDAGPAESGADEHGTAYDEQLVVHAHSTHGVFREGVRTAAAAEHLWAPTRAGGEDLARLWFVARDDRGGVDWVERRVRVRGIP